MQNNTICSNVNGPRDFHTEQYKSERQISYTIIFKCNLKKNGSNEVIYKTNSHRYWKQPMSNGGGAEGRTTLGDLLYIKQTTNKILLYSTGNSPQYSEMAYMGK